jgi:hypothetical protein
MSWKVLHALLAGLDMLTNLQVLRYLRFERNVLHRDISKGNVLYIPEPRSSVLGDQSSLALGAEGDSLCFIKCLLGDRYVYTFQYWVVPNSDRYTAMTQRLHPSF